MDTSSLINARTNPFR